MVFMQLDLASFKSIRNFAETFLKTEPRLDLLINNAGERVKILLCTVIDPFTIPSGKKETRSTVKRTGLFEFTFLLCVSGVMGPGRTQDGFGMAFGVNHLGHFLLTNLLLERLQQCGPSRVITVSALLHRLGHVNFPLLASEKDLVSGQSTWHNIKAYSSSKLCNVLFTRELANRLEGTSVSCYTLHPGTCSLIAYTASLCYVKDFPADT